MKNLKLRGLCSKSKVKLSSLSRIGPKISRALSIFWLCKSVKSVGKTRSLLFQKIFINKSKSRSTDKKSEFSYN